MIRLAQTEDIPVLKEFISKLLVDSSSGSLLKGYSIPDKDIEIYLQTPSKRMCLMLEEDNRPIGFVMFSKQAWQDLSIDFSFAKIDYIFIDQEHRGKDYMNEVHTAFEHWGKMIGASCYMLGVSKEDADLTKRGYLKSEVMYIKEVK